MAERWVDPALRPRDEVPGTPEWRERTEREALARAFSEVETDDERLLELMAFHKRSRAPRAAERHAAARAEVLRRMKVGR